MIDASADTEAFIRANTSATVVDFVPEFTLHLATRITPIWQATEDWLHAQNIAPPFWAFAWPGSQAIARALLDEPSHAAGRRVLDFAAGCGLAALAAARAGAALVEAAEIDPFAIAAIGLNAADNHQRVHVLDGDVVGAACRWDLILCGDICYEASMAKSLTRWLRSCARQGATVWLADPGRAYVPTTGLRPVATYQVPTTRELEDRDSRTTTIFELLASD